jgi:hypothetical protein
VNKVGIRVGQAGLSFLDAGKTESSFHKSERLSILGIPDKAAMHEGLCHMWGPHIELVAPKKIAKLMRRLKISRMPL